MDTAEKLWSASTRGLLKFEDILPIPGMPNGGIGVGPANDSERGKKAFWKYTQQPVVLVRLEAEGFVRSAAGAPHPWHLVKGNGRVSPADKAACRSLTDNQRKRIEEKRVAALKRRRVQQDVSAVHRELSADAIIAAMGDHRAHYPDTRPCSLCGHGDDAGTIIHCDQCNAPYHDACAGAPPVAGDWLCANCK